MRVGDKVRVIKGRMYKPLLHTSLEAWIDIDLVVEDEGIHRTGETMIKASGRWWWKQDLEPCKKEK